MAFSGSPYTLLGFATSHIGEGIGHVVRVASLLTQLEPMLDAEVAICIETSRDPKEVVVPTGIPVQFSSDRESSHAVWKRIANSVQGKSRRLALITDLRHPRRADALYARRLGFDLIVHMNDSALAREYGADLIVDMHGIHGESSNVLASPIYTVLRKEVTQARPASPWKKGLCERVTISLGGEDPGHVSETVLEELDHELVPKCLIVLGPAFGLNRSNDLRGLALNRGVEAMPLPSNFVDLILRSDLIVTLGGMTSREAMALGRPVASISWSWMTKYVRHSAWLGLCQDLGPPAGAAARLASLTADVPRLQGLAEAGWIAIDGQGASRIGAQIARLSESTPLQVRDELNQF